MTSASIYTTIKPTYLYIKKHSITGLKYFGKTSQDPYKYLGSGLYWKKHIKKHGKKFIETIWVSELYYDTLIVDIAVKFSIENNIVESKDWANMRIENGLDGGDTSLTKNYIKYKSTLMIETKKKCKWWNNGIKQCHCEYPPSSDYVRGRLSFNNVGSKLGAAIQKNKIWINDGKIEYMQKSSEPIPDNFIKGRLTYKAFNGYDRSVKKGVKWWNNGETECMKLNQPSSDYVRGRLKSN
jgi:hypothetical protein